MYGYFPSLVLLGSPASVTRYNLCPNPACGSNVTGWGGGSMPTQSTGLTGLPVTTGAHYTANNYAQTPAGTATPGLQYTASVYFSNNTGFSLGSKTVYLAFTRSSGGDDFSQTASVTLPTGVTQISITGTAPALATGVYLLVDNFNATFGSGVDITACLIEQTGTLGTYFDGDTSGASWDGTANNSTSTFGGGGATGTTLTVQPGGAAPAGVQDSLPLGIVLADLPATAAPAGAPVALNAAIAAAAQPGGSLPVGVASTFVQGTQLAVRPGGTTTGGSTDTISLGIVAAAQPGGASPGGSACTITVGSVTGTTLTVQPGGALSAASSVQLAVGLALSARPGGSTPNGLRSSFGVGFAWVVLSGAASPAYPTSVSISISARDPLVRRPNSGSVTRPDAGLVTRP